MDESAAFDSQKFLAAVGNGRTIQTYNKGQTVFAQGDPADSVFYVLSGKVKITILSPQARFYRL